MDVAVAFTMNLLRSTLSGRIDDEGLAASLLRVRRDGYMEHLDDWAVIGKHPDASKVLHDWIAHFSGWFGKMVRDCNIPVEVAQQRIGGFQACLVEHLHHIQDIWRDHTKDELPAIKAWSAMEWLKPRIHPESNGQREFRYLYQTVLIPDVVTNQGDTRLEIPVPPRCNAQLILPLGLYISRPLPEEPV